VVLAIQGSKEAGSDFISGSIAGWLARRPVIDVRFPVTSCGEEVREFGVSPQEHMFAIPFGTGMTGSDVLEPGSHIHPLHQNNSHDRTLK
jgi:hypothetical protein